MIICKIIGGLGNQLFQIAAARSLAIELNQDLYLDLSFFDEWEDPDVYRLDRYNVEYKLADPKDVERLKRVSSKSLVKKGLRKMLKKPFYNNAKFHYDQIRLKNIILSGVEVLNGVQDLYLDGYFADPLYFEKHDDEVRKELTLKDGLNKENQLVYNEISKNNSVSLHIRRGDYLSNSFFANLPLSYYEKASGEIIEKVDDPVFYVFSDDLEWVKENLKIDAKMNFVGINDKSTDYMELALMAACKHNIIANSTFSWWGAWLNNNPDKLVYVPMTWYNDEKAQKNYLKKKVSQKGWKRV